MTKDSGKKVIDSVLYRVYPLQSIEREVFVNCLKYYIKELVK